MHVLSLVFLWTASFTYPKTWYHYFILDGVPICNTQLPSLDACAITSFSLDGLLYVSQDVISLFYFGRPPLRIPFDFCSHPITPAPRCLYCSCLCHTWTIQKSEPRCNLDLKQFEASLRIICFICLAYICLKTFINTHSLTCFHCAAREM